MNAKFIVPLFLAPLLFLTLPIPAQSAEQKEKTVVEKVVEKVKEEVKEIKEKVKEKLETRPGSGTASVRG